MKFSIIGGDLRIVKLAQMLAAEKNEIYVPMLKIAHENKIVPHGSATELYQNAGLSSDKIFERIISKYKTL